MSDKKSSETSAVDKLMADDATRKKSLAADVSADEAASHPEGEQDLRCQLAEAKERALRMQAEMDNYRKRVRRDAEQSLKYAALPLIRDLLPVIDNLQRAVESQETEAPAEGVLAGVNMVLQQLIEVLAKHDCAIIEADGQTFDPMFHEAVLQQPSQQPPGQVIQVTQPGYKLHDRVVRPSQVIVSKAMDPE